MLVILTFNQFINSLSGIEYFTNLTYLDCAINQLTNLNISGLINLGYLDCGNNQLTNLNLNGLNLSTLFCGHNQLTSLDFSGMSNIYNLACDANQLTSLDLSTFTNSLVHLSCAKNQLTSLDVGDLTKLETFWASLNQFTSLDFSNNKKLVILNCADNNLETLFIKNGIVETTLYILNNPNLIYICADDNQLTDVQNKINESGYVNCNVNSYCTFTPGGTFYVLNGQTKLDANSNGCDVLDNSFANMKFTISNGTSSGRFVSNTTGSYSMPLQAGTYTIMSDLENPNYFIVSPPSVNVTFPTQASPFTQNFCVRANGVHPDLEVTILPLQAARPGFDAIYKLIYKNKGNTTQSGTVNLAFNDAVLDLVSANPVATTQTVNNLSWDFSNLLPFEIREITLILNINSSTETPAINSGDVLNYTANISSVATDNLPADNTFAFPQTVVNSFDPNDKTCLEGTKIAPEKVGEYVHYMIRFENNGTANAQNILVKDIIDIDKFYINSLVPVKGSHSFTTNIKGNKVEFIFENINLPFDDANNDGYVVFKIKTKSTLVLGNTFSNLASIYFDYNFPIVTNTATTTIAVLSVQDFVFSNYFSVYPNPVTNVLNISAKESIEVSSINIYNTLGQLVLVIPNAQNTKTVDVSALTIGNYFIKINSDKGTSNTKFIKK
jgi:uncharacterized repeat protein (TIGR01451 family)